ncbi:MAG: hypothetical protein AB7Q42_05990 [Acidimicrobiia bacterium]
MAISRLPLSTERLQFVAVSVEQKSDFDTGVQKVDRDGVPQWKVTLLVTSDELKAETCECTVSGKTAPAIQPLTHVQLESPMASLWQQGTRAGLAISAKSIRPANAAKPAAATNGTPETANAGAK